MLVKFSKLNPLTQTGYTYMVLHHVYEKKKKKSSINLGLGRVPLMLETTWTPMYFSWDLQIFN